MIKLSRAQCSEAVAFVSDAIADGYILDAGAGTRGAAIDEGLRRYRAATGTPMGRHTFRNRVLRAKELYRMTPKAKRLKSSGKHAKAAPPVDLAALSGRLRAALKPGAKSLPELSIKLKCRVGDLLDVLDMLKGQGVNVLRTGDKLDIPPARQAGYLAQSRFEFVSRADNTFSFGAFGDLHAASKHTRWDVREDLIRRSEKHGVQAILDTGNWIDGECNFNRYDLEVVGLEQQCAMLARRHPRTELPIYAVTGDDHEGWYEQRDGINVGKYAESIMRSAGHQWTDLGYMEAHVMLRNAKSGKTATLAIVHPGGGSAYALSYSIQKIVESYEGGEKPAVGLYGHYHKLWAGIIRNVWVVQTGTQQDQTPFMRKKRLEAHVGGSIIDLEQDPRTGAIISMTPKLLRYFNRGFYSGGVGDLWSHSGAIVRPKRSIAAIAATRPRGAGAR